MKFYEKLKKFQDQLPDAFRQDHNFTPQTCWLRCVSAYSEFALKTKQAFSSHIVDVATSILNSLNSEMVVPIENLTVKQLIINTARRRLS